MCWLTAFTTVSMCVISDQPPVRCLEPGLHPVQLCVRNHAVRSHQTGEAVGELPGSAYVLTDFVLCGTVVLRGRRGVGCDYYNYLMHHASLAACESQLARKFFI